MPERTPDRKEWIEDVRVRVDALGLTPAKADRLLEEIAQHLYERVADLQRSGVSESEARRLALDEALRTSASSAKIGRLASRSSEARAVRSAFAKATADNLRAGLPFRVRAVRCGGHAGLACQP
jgi:hypothetical protein